MQLYFLLFIYFSLFLLWHIADVPTFVSLAPHQSLLSFPCGQHDTVVCVLGRAM